MSNSEKWLGDGCKTCPVQNCQTMQYRSSTCAAQRAQYGVNEDPYSWGDKIRSESNEYIAAQLVNFFISGMESMAELAGVQIPNLHESTNKEKYVDIATEMLNAPYAGSQFLSAAKDGRAWTAPCKPGQIVYWVNSFLKEIKPVKILSVIIDINGIQQYDCFGSQGYSPICLKQDDLNKSWFIDKELAEKELEKRIKNPTPQPPVPKSGSI